MMNGVILSAAKNLPCDGQMLHFVQHDNPSNKLRQNSRTFFDVFAERLSLIPLSFEEHHKSQYARKGNCGGHKENGSPLELTFFSEFVHYDAGKLRPQE